MNRALELNILKQFPEIDTTNSNLIASIANYLSDTNRRKFSVGINPYSEAINLDDLVGEQVRWLIEYNTEIAQKIDLISSLLVNTNNLIESRLDALETQIGNTRQIIDDLKFSKADEGTDFVWLTDSFNSSIFISSNSGFLNSDNGSITLRPTRSKKINDFDIELDYDNLINQKALPGSNLLVTKLEYANDSVRVFYDQTDSTAISSLSDNDPITRFEVERNFIYPTQKLTQKGKAWISDTAGNLGNVKQKTQDLDWTAKINWLGREVEQEIAQFINPNEESTNSNNLIDYKDRDYNCHLKGRIILKNPTELSALSITPHLENFSNALKVTSLAVIVEGVAEPIVVKKNVFLNNENNSSNTISTTYSKNASEGTHGVNYSIPTDRLVREVVFHFEGLPSHNLLLAHPFVWLNIHRRSERNYGLFSSVDHEDIQKRVPVFESTPYLTASFTPNSVAGSIFLNPTTKIPAKGSVVDSEVKKGPLDFAKPVADLGIRTSNVNKAANITSIPASILSGAVSNIVGNFLNIGGFSRDFTVTDQQAGFDVFMGSRSSVGLRDISLYKFTYENEASITTAEREFAVPVKSFGLYLETEIPEGWPPYEWIETYVSIEGGDWQKIEPLKGIDLDQSLKFQKPIKRFKLQFKIKNNPNDIYRSPIIKHYATKGLPA